MHGRFEPLYIQARRKDIASLPPPSAHEHFVWTDAAAAGLDEIKTLLASNQVLKTPNTGEPMLLYIAATHQVVSAVLIVEREAGRYKFPL